MKDPVLKGVLSEGMSALRWLNGMAEEISGGLHELPG